jgi:hypothetical protein
MSELEGLKFLIGHWQGTSTDQFGEKGTLEGTMECSWEPSERFLQIKAENWKEGKLVNRSIQFITFDPNTRRFVGKRVWSMGFIENGVGTWDGKELLLDIKFDCEPSFFRGMRWKSFLRKYGENEIGHGLFTAKEDEPFRLYGETRETRVRA